MSFIKSFLQKILNDVNSEIIKQIVINITKGIFAILIILSISLLWVWDNPLELKVLHYRMGFAQNDNVVNDANDYDLFVLNIDNNDSSLYCNNKEPVFNKKCIFEKVILPIIETHQPKIVAIDFLFQKSSGNKETVMKNDDDLFELFENYNQKTHIVLPYRISGTDQHINDYVERIIDSQKTGKARNIFFGFTNLYELSSNNSKLDSNNNIESYYIVETGHEHLKSLNYLYYFSFPVMVYIADQIAENNSIYEAFHKTKAILNTEYEYRKFINYSNPPKKIFKTLVLKDLFDNNQNILKNIGFSLSNKIIFIGRNDANSSDKVNTPLIVKDKKYITTGVHLHAFNFYNLQQGKDFILSPFKLNLNNLIIIFMLSIYIVISITNSSSNIKTLVIFFILGFASLIVYSMYIWHRYEWPVFYPIYFYIVVFLLIFSFKGISALKNKSNPNNNKS